jgi:hypothetical protein
MSQKSTHLNRVSNDKLLAVTGKSWTEWFEIINNLITQHTIQKPTAKTLSQEYGLEDYWAKTIIDEFDFDNAFPRKENKNTDFEISATLTIQAPLHVVEQGFTDSSLRRMWLPEVNEFKKYNTGKNVRFDWIDDTLVSVNFYPKNASKCQVSLQHSKIKELDKRDHYRQEWKTRLDLLALIIT